MWDIYAWALGREHAYARMAVVPQHLARITAEEEEILYDKDGHGAWHAGCA